MLRVAIVAALAAAATVSLVPAANAYPLGSSTDASDAFLNATSNFAGRDISSSLRDCLGKTGATLTFPGDSSYAKLSKANNDNFSPKPEVLASPSSTDQVAAVIKCVAAQHGATKLSPRSGGHGYAAYSLSGPVVLDSSKMASIKIDEDAKTVRVGFGQTLGPLADAMAAKGFALPHGTCPTVGVAGHALGGGWGYSSRKWGWLMDHIVEMDMVDATGGVHTLSASSTGADKDLWWALRGAGSNNFGVVTHFTYAMETAPAKTVNYNHVYGSNDDCAQALVALQTLGGRAGGDAPFLPNELGGELLMYGENSGNDGACSFSGQYLGSKSDYQTVMKKLNDELASVGVKASSVKATEFSSWKAALTNLMGDLHQPKVYEPYYAQSIMDDGTPGYTLDSAKAITKAVQDAVGVSGTGNSISFDLNGPVSLTNSQPAPHGDMSFTHRSSLFFSQIYSYGFPPMSQSAAQQSALSKLNGVTDAVRNAKPDGDWHAYQNYIDPNLKDFGTAYYGSALDRLKSIKKTADPQTIFDFPQGLAHA